MSLLLLMVGSLDKMYGRRVLRRHSPNIIPSHQLAEAGFKLLESGNHLLQPSAAESAGLGHHAQPQFHLKADLRESIYSGREDFQRQGILAEVFLRLIAFSITSYRSIRHRKLTDEKLKGRSISSKRRLKGTVWTLTS